MDNLRDERDKTVVKEYVTWQDVIEFTETLAHNTNNFEKYNGVYGPARGGVIFAIIISEQYDLPYLGAPQPGCLVVDDIVDTGKTALCWLDKGYDIASMYFKENSLNVKPKYWSRLKTDKWIIFPWEKQD